MKTRILFALLLIAVVSVFLSSNFGYSGWSYPNMIFNVTPDVVYINWTYDYRNNITITVNETVSYWFNVTVDNSTALYFNYTTNPVCTDFPCVYLLVKNATGAEYITNSNNMTGGNISILTLIKPTSQNLFAGKYRGDIKIYNTSNETENVNITVFLDFPVQIDSVGMGLFNGTLPINASTYQSFYFNTSSVQNATGVVINLTSSQDVDVFLFDNSNQKLMAKSINKAGNVESLIFNFLPSVWGMWEIRIYGNYTSPINYYGNVFFTTLNITNASDTNQQFSSIDFGVMNVSDTKQINITLKNEGNLTLTGVNEIKDIYYVKRFGDSSAKNFTFLVPDSSIATKVKAILNWTGAANYSFNLFKPDGTLVASSTNKYVFANVSGAEHEEYDETTDVTSGYWRIEVKNNSVATSPYNVKLIIYLKDSSNWFASNYSSGFTFNRTGLANSSQTIQINFTVQNTSLDGTYEGYLQYLDKNNVGIKIPIKVNVTTPVLVVNQTINSSIIRIKENIDANLTKVLNITINNTGNLGLSIFVTNSTSLNNSYYYIKFTSIQYPSSLPAGSSAIVNITMDLNTSTTNDQTGLYKGWIFFNTSGHSHPYDFNLSIELELTDLLNVNVGEIETADGDNVANVTVSEENITVYFNITYINGTKITGNSIFSMEGLRNITSVRLYEANGSYWIPNITGSLTKNSLTVSENPSNSGNYQFNITIPANQPGGQYEVRINVTTIDGKLHGESSNRILIINDTGFYMNSSTTSITITNSSSTTFTIYIHNFGPLTGGTNIYFDKGSCPVTVSYLSCGLSCSNPGGTNVSISIPGYTSGILYNATWTITGSGSGNCEAKIYGSSKWFNNISLPITVNPSVTTTTVISTTGANATTTTTSTTSTTTSTTTTTIPITTPINQTFNISIITPEEPAVLNILETALKIKQIILAVNKNVTNVTITVKEATHPAGAPNVVDQNGVVFKYLDISAINVTADDIVNVKINFQVEKNWINLSNVDRKTIALYRYFNSSWEKLPTNEINETADVIIFQSISPGLSIFAIAGQKIELIKGFGFPLWIIFVVVGIVAAIILAYLFWPVKEEQRVEPLRIEEKKEEDVIAKLKEKWSKLSKQKK